MRHDIVFFFRGWEYFVHPHIYELLQKQKGKEKKITYSCCSWNSGLAFFLFFFVIRSFMEPIANVEEGHSKDMCHLLCFLRCDQVSC